MNHDCPLTWYVHRNLDAPIHQSIAALDTFARFASLRPAARYARLLAQPVHHSGPAPPGLPNRAFTGHVRLARWTFPTWLYVSVTGVVIYVMLYRLYPAGVPPP